MAFDTDILGVFDRLVARYPQSSLAITWTVAPGGNSKAIAAPSCLRHKLKPSVSTDGGLDLDTCTFMVKGAQFLTGFSTANPVLPSRGHKVTVAGETAWDVGAVESVDEGTVWLARCSRRRKRGAA